MEESSLTKKSGDDMRQIYVRRRLVFFGALAVLLILVVGLYIVTLPQSEVEQPDEGAIFLPPPIFERGLELKPVIINITNDTVNETLDCDLAPLADMGCLELNEEQTIFGAYGLNVDDREVRRLIREVEEICGEVDLPNSTFRDCVIDTTVYESESSWVCEWDCLEDLSSCETYKMHLAVAVLRQYVPPTDVFVARTDNFNFFIIYKDNAGDWIQKFAFGLTKPKIEALYNDVYHVGPITEVIFPDILEVEAGDEFCFRVEAPRSCVCSVEVSSFLVGDCPQLPADLKGICDAPVEEVYLNTGKNDICFQVDEDADEEFYTYNFELTSGEGYIPAGDAFILQKRWDCCVNESFKGFLSIE